MFTLTEGVPFHPMSQKPGLWWVFLSCLLLLSPSSVWACFLVMIFWIPEGHNKIVDSLGISQISGENHTGVHSLLASI